MFIENDKNEEWKDIEGYEGRYKISSLGRVKSFVGTSNPEGMLLRFSEVDGYYRAHLTDSEGERKGILVHRLVATAFIENELNKPQVNHIDSNRKNNQLYNLEWVTNKENSIHSWEYGGRTMTESHRRSISETRIKNGVARGENNPMYGKKFSEEHRQKISNSLKGKYVGENNPNYGRRGGGKSIKILAVFPDGSEEVYLSLNEAGEETGMDNSHLSKMLRKHGDGYTFKKTGVSYYRILKNEENTK